jgi:hypothetical protein
MCLSINKLETKELLADPRKTFKCYKVVMRYAVGKQKYALQSKFYCKYKWKVGEHVSTSKRKQPCLRECEEINRGIHVYTSLDAARSHVICGSTVYTVLEVLCKKTDLIGVEGDTAAFTKVYVTKVAYARALKSELNRGNS